MSRSSVAFGLGTLLLAAGVAGALLLGGVRPSAPDPAEPLLGAREASSQAIEAPPLPSTPAPRSAAPPERSLPIPDFASRRTATVRGRVVMEGSGAPVASATVTVRTGSRELDFPETFALLGGAEGIDRSDAAGELGERVRGFGGWKAAHRAVTGADGAFEIPVPPDLPAFRFQVDSEFAAARDRTSWFSVDSSAGEQGWTIELEPAGSVAGTVTTSSGKPAAGARVALVREPYGPGDRVDPLEADASGHFAFRGVPVGRFVAGALGEGTAPAVLENVVVREGKATRLDFRLSAESWIAGKVVDASGAGLGEASLRAFPEPGAGPDLLFSLAYGVGRSAADGTFRMRSLRAGPHTLFVRREGMLGPKQERVDLPEAGGVEGIDIVLARPRVLAGVVLDVERRPVAGARVSVLPDWTARKFRASRWSTQSTTTAQDGCFRLTGVSEGPVVLDVHAEGRGQVERRGLEADSQGIEILLPGPTGIAGAVRDAETGEPVQRYRIDGYRVLRRIGDLPASTQRISNKSIASEDGSFEHLDVDAGSLVLAFEAEGFVREMLGEIEVRPGEIRRGLEVRLRRAATIRGTVVARDAGTPVYDASIQLFEEDRGPGLTLHPSDFLGRRRCRSEPDGAFELRNLDPGRHRLRVSHDSFVPALSDPIEAKGGETIEGLVISLPRGGGVDGHASAEGRTPLVGGTVMASPVDFGGAPLQEKAIETDREGYFRLEGLAPGRWTIEASPPRRKGEEDPEAGRLRAVVLVEEGRTTRVEFPGPPKGGCTVRGRVLRGGAGAGGASVFVDPLLRAAAATDPVGTRLGAMSEADGSFAIEHVPPGAALLEIQVRSSRGASSFSVARRRRSIEVPEAVELVLDVELPGGAIQGRVVRASDGRPVPGAAIEVLPSEFVASRALAGSRGWAQTDEEGRYRVEDLEPGAYVAIAHGLVAGGVGDQEAARLEETRGPIEVAEGGEAVVDFSLSAGGSALVSVLDPAGRPVEGALVSVVPAGGPGRMRRYLAGGHGMTDVQGVARVAGLAPGVYYATVASADYAGADSDEAEVRVGGEASFRVNLREGTRVRVRVLDRNDAPVDLLPLFVDSRGRERFAVPVEARGFPRQGEQGTGIVVLLPGEYTVRIGGEGWTEQATNLRVGTRSPQDLVLRLERAENP
jgi:carboxypeptidase family protein